MLLEMAILKSETWLTGGASDQKIVGGVTPAGYGFHHTARTYRKGGCVGILIRDSLKLQNHFRFLKIIN